MARDSVILDFEPYIDDPAAVQPGLATSGDVHIVPDPPPARTLLEQYGDASARALPLLGAVLGAAFIAAALYLLFVRYRRDQMPPTPVRRLDRVGVRRTMQVEDEAASKDGGVRQRRVVR